MRSGVNYGLVARPLGAADVYLFAIAVLCGALLALTARALSETAAARMAFRDELSDANVRLEDCDELLRDAHTALNRRAAAAAVERREADKPAAGHGHPWSPT